MKGIDFAPFAAAEPVMWNALVRKGWDSVPALADLRLPGQGDPRGDLHGWEALWELRNIGPRRILALVNFLRDSGVELSWMADFDARSAHWTALEGMRRAAKPGD
jgi:hypothetical protein